MKQIKTLSILVLAALVLGACTKDFEDINTNPNRISYGEVQPSNVFEPLMIYGLNDMISEAVSYGYQICGVAVATGSNVREEHRYNLNNQNYTGRWNAMFEWALLADHMYDLAVAQNDPNYQAIGLTMKVYYMQQICDLFGGIPYREAFGISEGIRQPEVESQQEVYTHMMEDLEKANSLYAVNSTLSGRDKDALYGGNLVKWQKFTNTLHLRLLCRVSGRNEAFTPSVSERMQAILNDPATYPVFESNDDNALVNYSGATAYYSNTYSPLDYANESAFAGERHISEVVIDRMVFEDGAFVDPRLPIWGKTRVLADYKWKGAIPGCSKDYANSGTISSQESWFNFDSFVRDKARNIIISYDELLFIKAEAAFNGWISGSAEDYYNQAIAASCKKWNEWGEFASVPTYEKNGDAWVEIARNPVMINDDMVAELLARPEVAYNNTLQRIAEQKWLALFWVGGFEMFNEMRRTGYPEVKIGKGILSYNYTDGKFIARMPYPQIAISNNSANYEKAIKDMGGVSVDDNLMTLPVWWSGQAVAKDAGAAWPHSFRTLQTREE